MSDSTELAHRQEGGAVATHRSEAAERFSQTITMVREAMLNKDVDANKAKVMAELMTSLEDRSMKAEFNRDLNAAMAEMPIITKDGKIVIPGKGQEPDRVQGRFAKLEDMDRVIKPIARRHFIGYRWDVGHSESGPIVQIILTHDNGFEWVSKGMKMPLDTSGGKNNVQGAGSSVTYGQRYTLKTAFNIQTEGLDDDGGSALVALPHERENLVITEAEAAALDGRYVEWFSTQGPKDRAWLLSSGHHERLGGQPMLAAPGRSASPSPPPQQENKDGPKRQTAEDWTKEFEAGCKSAPTMEALELIRRKGNSALGKLSETNPKLWERADAAFLGARERLNAAPADSLFPGDAQ